MISQLRSIWTILQHTPGFRRLFGMRSETVQYPEEMPYLAPRYRGRIVLTRDPDGEERCVACNLCAVACPVDCIALQKTEKEEDGRWYPEFFRINFSRCIMCGLCEEACPTYAIQLTPDLSYVNSIAPTWCMRRNISSSVVRANTLNTVSGTWPVKPLMENKKVTHRTKRHQRMFGACCRS